MTFWTHIPLQAFMICSAVLQSRADRGAVADRAEASVDLLTASGCPQIVGHP